MAEEPWVARGKGGRRKDGVVDGWISGGGLEEEKKTRPPLAFHFDCVDNFLVLLMLTKISNREESQREKSREKKNAPLSPSTVLSRRVVLLSSSFRLVEPSYPISRNDEI